ncbi:MAG: multifunctional CCA tRNA nucleotidyl transferase/2'3'-cyclic phosphodiesterase/2'nucleotidase/phosphatase [Neisseriales bacterium]|nr:MAG: multifunctional CCA tRNA nucleotidyl transferase/2'3'-cyclic phosphodiesterase/2'nucleotidase/phosphatase [Neisseriales bacterium]
MKIYAVGGSVRDKLLGLPIQDKDYVVVGASEQTMKALGYQPIGRDFPVFLHPTTHEEYALARTEKKVATGYGGFVFHVQPDVTLKEDLARRDLTINAMAEDKNGVIIDPFGGQQDLSNKLLRHTSLAFVEDPVRVLRVARFAARLNFTVHPSTLSLMKQIVASDEMTALVPERIWQELAKGLMEKYPLLLLSVLNQCGALAILLPEIAKWYRATSQGFMPYQLKALDDASARNMSLAQRFAIVMHTFDIPIATLRTQIQAISCRLKVPNFCQHLAIRCADMIDLIRMIASVDLSDILRFFQRIRAFQANSDITSLFEVCHSVLCASVLHNTGHDTGRHESIQLMQVLLQAAQNVDTACFVKERDTNTQNIADAIFKARLKAMYQAKQGFLS